MAISIKDPATDLLARQLAALTGESLTDAIRIALEERLARQQRPARQYPMHAAVRRLQERLASLPVIDATPGDELLYDEYGLPK